MRPRVRIARARKLHASQYETASDSPWQPTGEPHAPRVKLKSGYAKAFGGGEMGSVCQRTARASGWDGTQEARGSVKAICGDCSIAIMCAERCPMHPWLTPSGVLPEAS